MTEQTLVGYDGPRPVRLEEWDDLVALVLGVFYPRRLRSEGEPLTWPVGFSDELRERTWIIAHRGRPVSAVGHIVRDLVIAGHVLRMAFIGGVCTAEAHRGRGLASLALHATFAHLRERGVDLVYISGARGLYRRAGAHPIGAGRLVEMRPGVAPPLTTSRLGCEAIGRWLALATDSATRFFRPASDLELVLTHGYCCGRPVELLGASASGLEAMLLSTLPAEQEGRRVRLVLDYVGAPEVLVGALAGLATEVDLVRVQVPWRDPLGARLVAAGCPATARASGGTVKVLSFGRLLERLRPWLAELYDPGFVASLGVADAGSRYVMFSADGALVCEDETALARALLGRPPGDEGRGIHLDGRLRELVERCLPVPLPAWDLSTI